MSYFDDASLVLIPSGYKDQKLYAVKPLSGDGDLTFIRASNATRVASNGLIEKVRTNEIRNSTMVGAAAPSTLPTNWTLVSGGLTFTVIGTGTEDGYTYLDVNASGTASSSNARIGFDSSTQIVATTGQYWTNSFYFKKISEAAAPSSYALSIAENTAVGSSVITNVVLFTPTTTLARYSYSLLTAGGATVARVQPFLRFALTAAASYDFTFRIAAPQMEQNDIATDYIATTTAAVSVGPVSGLPRLDYLNSSCPRLLLEPQRTNLAFFSEQFDNAAWTKGAGTITANNAVSPDGYQNADLFTADGTTTQHFVLQTQTAGAKTISFFVKMGTQRYVQILTSGIVNALANYDLQTGSVGGLGSASTASMVDYGNGWWRIILTSTDVLTGNIYLCYSESLVQGRFPSTTSTGTIWIWGAMAENGATYASSYVNTLSTSVTRVADAASKTGISSLIGQTEGTIFVDFVKQNNASDTVPFDITGSDGKLIWIRRIGAQFYGNGTTLLADISSGSGTQGTRYKIAFVYGQNDFRVYSNGSLIGTDISGTFTGSFSNIALNSVINQANGFNQILLFKTKLTNAQLAELTTL